MRILLDPGTPELLRRWLINHEVSTVAEKGWSAVSSLNLIQLAEQRGYGVFISTDVSLKHHPNLQRPAIAILMLSTGEWERVGVIADNVADVVNALRPGAALLVVHLEPVGCFLRTAEALGAFTGR